MQMCSLKEPSLYAHAIYRYRTSSEEAPDRVEIFGPLNGCMNMCMIEWSKLENTSNTLTWLVYSKIPILRSHLGLSKSGLKDSPKGGL